MRTPINRRDMIWVSDVSLAYVIGVAVGVAGAFFIMWVAS